MSTQERVELAARILAEHGPAIRAIIRRYTRDADEQDDVYQNLYLTLVRSATTCPSTNILAYLDTVIRNDVIDAVRRRKTHEQVLSRYVDRITSRVNLNPEQQAIREEQLQQVHACVQALPRHEARAVVERFAHDRDTGETAKQMHVKDRTVSRYLCLGLRRVRKALTKRDVETRIFR